MNQQDQKTFVAIWRASHEAYRSQPSDMAVKLALETLKDYELQAIKNALTAHMKDPDGGRFAPKPADITLKIDGDPESRAHQAWDRLLTTLERTGPYKTVVFDDPKIMCIVEDFGGWIQFSEIKNDELPFKRNEFIKRYRGYLNKPPTRHPKQLIGLSDASNLKNINGYQISDPVLIGNPEKAALVCQGGKNKPQGVKTLSQVLDYMSLENKSNG